MTYHVPRTAGEYKQRQFLPWQSIDWTDNHPDKPRSYLTGNPPDIETGTMRLFSLHKDHAANLHITDAITRYWIGWDTPSSSSAYVDELLDRARQELVCAWVAYSNWDDDGHYSPLLGWRDCGRRPIGLVYFDALAQPFFGAWHELNFWLHEDEWGQGHATQMALAALDWAFEKSSLDRIMLSWTDGNIGSGKVIAKLLQSAQAPQIVAAEKSGRPVKVYNHVIERPVGRH